MKQKEIIQLIAAIVIFGVTGILIYTQLMPHPSGPQTAAQIEKVTQIPANFDDSAMKILTDTTKTKDFYNAPDLKSGLGNTQPFGPLH